MTDTSWFTPHLDAVSSTAAGACFVVYVVLGPLRGPAAYRRLVRARAEGRPGALTGFFRRRLRAQALRTALVLVTVALSGGLSADDLGLRLPSGPTALQAWGWTAYLCAVVLVAGLVMRKRVRSGRTVPGQRIFAALIPATAEERRLGAAVAVGAGVSEELVFRGLLTAAAASLLDLGPVGASVLVSVAFGVAHLYQGWRGVLGTGMLGGLLAWLYVLSGSLLPPILAHVAIDLRALVLVPAQQPDATARPRRTRRAPARPAPTSATAAADLEDGIGENGPVLP